MGVGFLSVCLSVRRSFFLQKLSPPTVFIVAHSNLAYRLTMGWGTKCWDQNFEILPLANFMGVEILELAKMSNFQRFFVHQSVALPNGTLIFSKMILLGSTKSWIGANWEGFKVGVCDSLLLDPRSLSRGPTFTALRVNFRAWLELLLLRGWMAVVGE